jgi:2-oxoglutarate dehydrogenase E1 component
MVCYRKHGHNEGDDPQFTQPQLYKKIKDHKDPRAIYVQQLIQRGEIEANLAAALDKEFDSFLQERFDLVKQKPLPYKFQEPELAWEKMKKVTSTEDYEKSPDTSISLDQVKNILSKLQNIPSDFHLLPKFKRILSRTDEFIQNETCDWSMAEHLAYGSLLMEGKDVRMSGQDVKRGTFSHRNAVLYDAETNQQYNRLNHIGDKQSSFRIFNSLLSEFAVLGFEYGYSIATPDSLVIWEAQFGDFVNGAQTIIDQFISSSESKWGRMSGLVMLLPHGYEGQGPEHSSARLERFLQSCAEFNLTVANVTTPANFFHLMRRQLARPFRKPLIVMSPKSLLRHPSCLSNFKDFTQGGFQEVIDAPLNGKEADQIKKVILCSGKVYYDLLSRKEETKSDEVAIIRLEQIYPFPKTQVDELIKKYKKAKFLWVQEEPSNMGAWQYILAFYRNFDIQLVARKSSASPATGYKKLHVKELKDILDRAITPITTPTKVS